MAPLIVEDYCMVGDDVSVTSSSSSGSSSMMDVDETQSSKKSAPQQQQQQQQQRQRKHVSFSQHSEEYDVLSRYDMSEEEIAAAWFDRFELRQFKTTAKSEAKLVDRGLYSDNNADSCTRGLECRTFDGTRQKRQRRLNAAAAVFMELDQQEEMGFGGLDEERLADAYYHWSQPCLVAAQMIALRDHRDAIDCWGPTQQTLSQKVATATVATATATATDAAAITLVDQNMFSGSSLQGILASSAA